MSSVDGDSEYVIRIMGTAKELWDEELWLEEMSTETGELFFTPSAGDAKRYPSQSEAIAERNRVPRKGRRRKDGLPNRPLSAFSVAIEPFERGDGEGDGVSETSDDDAPEAEGDDVAAEAVSTEDGNGSDGET